MSYANKICKHGRRSRKMKPYGAQKGKFWCDGCDAEKVSGVNKTKNRQQIRKQIKSEIE